MAVQVIIENYSEPVPHTLKKKRRLQPEEKVKICDMLQKGGSYSVRSKHEDEMIKSGSVEPSHLPSSYGLRKIESRDQLKDVHHVNPILSLVALKNYAVVCIQAIGAIPFYVYTMYISYSSELQKA